jgi:pSer/pThr/pTyr-binding forkhead associated (FHA) protein
MKSADLNIDDPDLSRRHVELFRKGERLFVRDLGSKNGSTLGDRRLDGGEEAPWPKGVMVAIGKSKLTYDDPVGRALEELESAPDERLDDSELIDPPKLPADRTASSVTGTGVPPSPSRRGAPVASRPRRAEPPATTGWTVTDVLVATLAVIVLAVSIGGLVWLMRSG